LVLLIPFAIGLFPNHNVWAVQAEKLEARIASLPLSFIPNAGQLPEDVIFMVKDRAYTVLFGSRGVTFVVHGGRGSAVVQLRFLGANEGVLVEGLDELPGTANFLLGDDPSRWYTKLPTYAGVVYRSLYPGIDLVYRGRQGQLKSEFVVSPGADPSRIAMEYRGTARVHLERDGTVVVETPLGVLVEEAPRLYQVIGGREVPVEGCYRLDGDNAVRIVVGEYDRTRPLIIDPELVYSTYLGGSDGDWAHAIAVDGEGCVYVAGYTVSDDFPLANPYQPVSGGWGDAFVAKLDPTGSSLLYSTYLGGSDNDWAHAIAVDGEGCVYVAGGTCSDD